MAAGGVALRPERYTEVTNKIQEIKCAAGIKGELKWSEYRGGKRRIAYEAVVDLCFLLARERQAALHWIIAHFAEFDHKSNEHGSPESSVNRMYFQLGLHRLCRFYGKKCAIYMYPDAGNDSKELVGYRVRGAKVRAGVGLGLIYG